jgi:hypothetical protein
MTANWQHLLEAKTRKHASKIYLCRVLKAVQPENGKFSIDKCHKTHIKTKYDKNGEFCLSGFNNFYC